MRRRESAFTVVEVIIAVLLVTVVISGVTLALAGGSKLETKRDIKSRMVAATERVYEHIRSDKAWIKSCRRASATAPPKVCNLTPIIDGDLLKDDIFGSSFKFGATASATGVDSDGDGMKGADADGNADDFFKITITITVPMSDAARLGSPPARKVESIVNGSTNVDSGGLLVAFCSADNQIDERVQISGCETGGTYWTEMPACAGDPTCLPWALSALQGIPGTITSPSRMLGIRPVGGVSFTLKRVADGEPFDGPGTISSALAVTAASDPSLGPGVYRFPDLPVGSWQIVTPAVYPGNRIDWPTHHVPSTKQATVERNRTARALVMLQDPASSNPFQMNFEREVHERWFTEKTVSFQTKWIPECEQPASYNQTWFGFTNVSCNTATGHMVIDRGSHSKAEAMGITNYGASYESTGSFRETVKVTYVAETGQADYVWQGAARAGIFSTQPAPSGRWSKRTDGPSGPTYSIPTTDWTVAVPEAPNWPAAGYKSVGSKAQVKGLPAGLADPVHLVEPSMISNVSTTWGPAGCDSRYLWVRPDNALGTCSSVRMRGNDGECYTNMNSPTGGVSYKRDPKCSSLKWPPVGGSGTISLKNNLIIRICTTRESRLQNIREADAWAYNTDLPNATNVTEQEFFDLQASWGYTFYPGTISIAGKVVGTGDGYFLSRTGPTNSSKTFDTGCRTVPSASKPLDCPSLDRWDNCSVAYSLQIPNTPGWPSGDGVEDGHRPLTSGGSIASMSP